jgi:hypothetical protein
MRTTKRPPITIAIKAKFPGKCSTCGQPYNTGDPLLMSQGSGARHATCELVTRGDA